MTAQSETPAQTVPEVPRGLVGLLTASMGLAMFVLFALGALGPVLLDELNLSPSQVGAFTAVAFGVASVMSLYAGHLADVLGGRLALVALLATVAVAFTVLSVGGAVGWLLAAMVLTGAAQSLANPATNRLIAARLPAHKRAGAVGVKQSGVQLGAFVAGLALPTLADLLSWRLAMALIVPVALALAVMAMRLPRDTSRGGGARTSLLPQRPNAAARWLILYSLGIGTGLAAVNTYLPLYAHQELAAGERAAGALIAALGAAGIVARVVWTRYSAHLADVTAPLFVLAAVAVVFVGLLPAAKLASPLVWIGAVGLGGSAVAANAVSMVAVVRSPLFGATGHASALVSMGFFAGFVVGPLGFGLLVDSSAGYQGGWAMVGAAFVVSILAAVGVRREVRA